MALRRMRSDFSGMTARALVAVLCAVLLVSGDATLLAQQAPAAAPAGEKAAPKLSGDQIDSLVAPIALYPDPLLSQTLVASTYPLEIIQAQQWLAKNSTLKGDALAQAAMKQDWDPSVQSMVTFPDLVKRLTEDITWTTNLGNAFLAQQEDVMDSVQRLRLKAKEAGKLKSSEQQTVTTKVVEKETVVVIQPASTQVVYVPTYSPAVIWGPPPYYPYPPIYYPPYTAGRALFTFSLGVAIGNSMHGGWGYGCGWGHGGGNTVVINNNNNYVKNTNIKNNTNVNAKSSSWQHNPQHRGAAPYANTATANKYGGTAKGASMSSRQAQARSAGATSYGSNRGASPSASASSRSAGASASNHSAGASASSQSVGAGASGSRGGDQVGGRSIPSSSPSSGSFGGGGSSPSHVAASSARGSSSMASSHSYSGGGRSSGGGRKR
jgi:hypothetical protein